MLTNYAAEIVRALSAKGIGRAGAAPGRVRRRAEAPRGRHDACRGPIACRPLIAQVDLARIDVPAESDTAAKAKAPAPVALPDALLADVRAQVARADREITDGYERQAVITAAAYLLEHAGLGARVRRLAQGQPGARATRPTT